MLSGKKILLIAPKFFGYQLEIQKKLIELGALADYFDERPENNFLTKALLRINKKLLKKKIYRYYKSIMKQVIAKEYDYVLVINVEAMDAAILKEFKTHLNKALFILYMWDSFQNKKHASSLITYFDRIFSFDREDTFLDKRVIFRPLFFIDSFIRESDFKVENKYSISFIGTVHSDRYKIIQTIKEENKDLTMLLYLYFPNKILFFYRKLINSSFRSASMKEVNFKALSSRNIAEVFFSSLGVLDINHPRQTGLTMRTFEVLGAGCKLITTNAHIKEYPFYNTNNIFIIDRNNPHIEKAFIEKPFIPYSKEINHTYSLVGWIEDIFR